MSRPTSWIAAFAKVVLGRGEVHVLVNGAGWGKGQPFVDNDAEFWEHVVDVNMLGPIKLTRALLGPMIVRRSGKIVNVASDAGRVGSSGETVYSGAKGGLIAFSKGLAREMARYCNQRQLRVSRAHRNSDADGVAGEPSGRLQARDSDAAGRPAGPTSPTPFCFSPAISRTTSPGRRSAFPVD